MHANRLLTLFIVVASLSFTTPQTTRAGKEAKSEGGLPALFMEWTKSAGETSWNGRLSLHPRPQAIAWARPTQDALKRQLVLF
jgi:hypothetical protein